MTNHQSNHGGIDEKDFSAPTSTVPGVIGKPRILPKGTYEYHFNAIGQSVTDPTKIQGRIVFSCIAINQLSALEKYRKAVEAAFSLVNKLNEKSV